ncbi:MAG: 3-phosphoshikimate 1-carboxyvinyltransferase [Candidatus Izemoplasmatales bacterium]|jgi:3-phosphoshikimate 1-carboxyvinyltransferase|nr:3-phosphoshikimate 1-carboxyvinyltransferase [Candidatus Izemoplasmatales bacterium]
MNIIIHPGFAKGDVKIPPSKSYLHRAIICASLAEGKSVIKNIILSEDVKATINALKTVGIQINKLDNALEIYGRKEFPFIGDEVIDCNESGSTLRFLIPLLTNMKGILFTGKRGLFKRPLSIYKDIYERNNLSFSLIEESLFTKGTIEAGNYIINGNISSQFISGLLFALPLKSTDTTIEIVDPFESKKYVDMTIKVLSEFGINIQINNNIYFIKGNQQYKPKDYIVEADYSQAAFFAVAGIINGEISISNLNEETLQPDYDIISIIKKMNGKIVKEKNDFRFLKSKTKGIEIDVSQCPDLSPILAVLGGLSEGKTVIKNVSRLKLKEIDRLSAIVDYLTVLGVKTNSDENTIEIFGQQFFTPKEFNTYNDHRIVMALAISALRSNKPLRINNINVINKSYPGFIDDLENLGIKVEYV